MFEEHKYKELKRLGTELHIPIFEAFLKLEVFDKDGKLVQEHSQRGHSWTRNAYNMMFSSLNRLTTSLQCLFVEHKRLQGFPLSSSPLHGHPLRLYRKRSPSGR